MKQRGGPFPSPGAGIRFLSGAAIGFAWLAMAAGAETTYPIANDPASGITFHLSTPLTAVPTFGFLPLHLHVDNASTHEGAWQFKFQTGQRSGFPGEVDSGIAISVPPGQSRDTWFQIPLAEPGVIFSAPGAPTSSTSTVPSAPPPTAGIYPGPEGAKTSFRIAKTTPGGATIDRTFVITQTGPAALLPVIPEVALPARTTMTVAPSGPAGEVKRTTTMTVLTVIASSTSGLGAPASPTDPIVDGARQKLLAAGLLAVRGTSASSSARATPSTVPNMSVVTVTFRQTGPTESLPQPPANQVPKGFDVEIAPGPMAGTTMRSFIYKENIATATLTAAAARATTSGRGGTIASVSGTTVTEAMARTKLTGTNLLTLPTGVTQTIEFNSISFAGLGTPLTVVVFIQTGAVGALPKPPAAQIPDDVVVNLHPGATPGQVVRTISFVDPAALAAAMGTASLSPTIATIMPLNNARVELARYGFLRSLPGVQQAGVYRTPAGILSTFTGTSSAGPGAALSGATPSAAGTGTTAIIVTETGPGALLPAPPQTSLPPGTTVNVTAGALPGETIRNFIVPLGGAGLGSVTSSSMTTRATSEFTASITGTGLASPLQVPLAGPLFSGSASTPPLAVSTPLEGPLRAKLAGLRGAPSLAPVDPGDLPDDWRVWSSFHGVVLRAADFATLDPAHRSALRSWVALGGQLFLVPEASDDDPVPTERIGAGAINTLLGTLDDLLPSDLGDQLHLGAPALSLPAAPAMAKFEEKSVFGAFIANPGASNLWLGIFLVVFALVVGPLNLFLFARGKRRYRLFLTTPLIAFCGAVTLGAAIVFQDGFGGEGVRTAIVALLPDDNTAVVFQDQVARTGLLRSTRFSLDSETLVTGIPLFDYNPAGRSSLLSRDANQADGDWFRNRWREAHHLRRLTPTRGRVNWVGAAANGAPIVESTLKTTLHSFVYIDDAGDSWSASEVAPGKAVTLAPTGRELWNDWMSVHFSGSKYLESVLVEVAPRESRRWMATGGDSEVAPIATLPSIQWTTSTVIYTGIAAGGGRIAAK